MQKNVLAFVGEPVIADEDLISSRILKDLSAFGKAMVDFLNTHGTI